MCMTIRYVIVSKIEMQFTSILTCGWDLLKRKWRGETDLKFGYRFNCMSVNLIGARFISWCGFHYFFHAYWIAL